MESKGAPIGRLEMSKSIPKWRDGTIKSMNTPFNWRFTILKPEDHMQVSPFAAEPTNCTPAFNRWRAAMRAGETTQDWPSFRDAFNSTGRSKRSRRKKKAGLTAPVPKAYHLHSLSGPKAVVEERERVKRAKLIGRTNHARSQ